MECLYCKGQMDKGKTTYTINRRGYHLLIEDVPSFVCKQCREPYFGEEEVNAIQGIINDMDYKTSTIQAMGLRA